MNGAEAAQVAGLVMALVGVALLAGVAWAMVIGGVVVVAVLEVRG